MPEAPTPPQPPQIPRRIRMPIPRLVGTLAIVLIPGLALWGVFGKTTDRLTMETPSFHAKVSHPSRLNYQEQSEILVRVENRAAAPITAVIGFDAEFIEAFSEVTFSPSEEKAYAVRLPSILPGHEAALRVSLRGGDYGSHRGRIAIEAGGATASASVDTFVFP